MGNGCSIFNINKVCFDGDIKISVNMGEEQNKNDSNKNNYNYVKKRTSNLSMKKQTSMNSNGKKFNNNLNLPEYNPCFSLASMQASVAIPILCNTKVDKKNKSNKMNSFTSFMDDFDVSFQKDKSLNQNSIFDLNYIFVNDNYNEEMIDYLNKIRAGPNNIIHDIDDLLKQKQYLNNNNKIQIESDKTHENIVFNDGGQALEETKLFLININPVTKNFNLNEDLLIDFPEPERNELFLPLDKKITKIIMEKRKNIIEKYPNCQFFINFIKDEKIGLLFLLSQSETMSNFRNIIFDGKYTEFNVSWMKEKKKVFIAFLCFA